MMKRMQSRTARAWKLPRATGNSSPTTARRLIGRGVGETLQTVLSAVTAINGRKGFNSVDEIDDFLRSIPKSSLGIGGDGDG
jgi:hypothetical protein